MNDALPRSSRPSTAAAVLAVALLLLGLTIGPLLLLRADSAALRLGNVRLQLYAAFLYWTVGAVLMVAPFLALMTIPGDWFERWWRGVSSRIMAIPARAFEIGLVILVFLACAFLSAYAFDRGPTTADSIAQLWHARILLDGRLSLPPDPHFEFFAVDNIIDRPRWMSQFPIGGAALHMLGVLTGATWLLNPVLTGIMALLLYRLARGVYGEEVGRGAAAVFATSPVVLIMGGTHMNHPATALCVMIAFTALAAWITATSGRRLHASSIVIGSSIGVATTIRPLDGVLAGIVIGLVMLGAAAREGRRSPSLLSGVGAGMLPLSLLLIANWKTTGNPLLFAYEVLWGPNHSLGLHDDPTGHPHSAGRALLLAAKYALQINWVATAWPIPVVLILAIGVLFALRHTRWDVLFLSYFCAQLIAYAFYWHDGQFVGPRFLFTAVPALLILAARAPFLVAERLGAPAHTVWRRIAIITIPVCTAVTWLRPMQPFGAQSLAREFRESRGRFKVDPPFLVQAGTVRNALIFIQEGASARLVHRLWGLGISRADAARLLENSDACSLFEAVHLEQRRADTVGRLSRIRARARPFIQSASNVHVADANLRISDTTAVTPMCLAEIRHDARVKNTVAYGPMLLLNRFDDSGRIAGDAIYVMDLRDRNEILRERFGNRTWYRYEIPRDRADTVPVLVPYGTAP
jgi:hypothetical protein